MLQETVETLFVWAPIVGVEKKKLETNEVSIVAGNSRRRCEAYQVSRESKELSWRHV